MRKSDNNSLTFGNVGKALLRQGHTLAQCLPGSAKRHRKPNHAHPPHRAKSFPAPGTTQPRTARLCIHFPGRNSTHGYRRSTQLCLDIVNLAVGVLYFEHWPSLVRVRSGATITLTSQRGATAGYLAPRHHSAYLFQAVRRAVPADRVADIIAILVFGR
ncbi:hypothetical protein HDF12_000470 [Edaphobacter lichenicola]|uniref:Uncharacterized protein n=1 Tax=Tunturiibacter lichenicola TaxID=2051959 RepID=A0A7Y9NJG7_9BACT|nr:hypothetical protein [Edaphobacter lichenicola]